MLRSFSVELRQLRYFVAVAEEQNVTRAAKKLYVSQPPVSRQVRALEKEIGVELFERTTSGLRLTPAGRTLLAEARAALRRTDDAISVTKAVARGRRGLVRVGFGAAATVEILPRALKAFRRTNPEVGVQLHEMSTEDMRDSLRDGSLDVALIMYARPEDFTGLEVEELGSHPVRIAVHKRHKFARMREVRMTDVAKEPLVTFSQKGYPEAHSFTRQILIPFARDVRFVDEYSSASALIAAIESGRGIALVSEAFSVFAGQRLVLRRLKPQPPAPPVGLAYRKTGLSAHTVAFIAAARAARLKRRGLINSEENGRRDAVKPGSERPE